MIKNYPLILTYITEQISQKPCFCGNEIGRSFAVKQQLRIADVASVILYCFSVNKYICIYSLKAGKSSNLSESIMTYSFIVAWEKNYSANLPEDKICILT